MQVQLKGTHAGYAGPGHQLIKYPQPAAGVYKYPQPAAGVYAGASGGQKIFTCPHKPR